MRNKMKLSHFSWDNIKSHVIQQTEIKNRALYGYSLTLSRPPGYRRVKPVNLDMTGYRSSGTNFAAHACAYMQAYTNLQVCVWVRVLVRART